MSSSDTRGTRSIKGWSGGVAEADKHAFSLNWNWALRYIAQRCERLKGVSSVVRDIWLVCILALRGLVKTNKAQRFISALTARLPGNEITLQINKCNLLINEDMLPRSRSVCNIPTGPPNFQRVTLPWELYTATFPLTSLAPHKIGSHRTTWAAESKAARHNLMLRMRQLGPQTAPLSLSPSPTCHLAAPLLQAKIQLCLKTMTLGAYTSWRWNPRS